MRHFSFAIVRLALVAIPPIVMLSVTGCATSSFGGAAPGYDQQACLERALRRAPDADNVARATAAFKLECREGGAEACSALGVMYEIGVGVAANPGRAVALYERACNAGNVRGCANLGVALIEGLGGTQDVAAGARLLEPACAHGDAGACVNLARLYVSGDGVSKDPIRANQLFEIACRGEEATACVALAEIRATAGYADVAAELYGKACGLGDPIACSQLDVRVPQVAASNDRLLTVR
jgi:uncharacterized protein